MDGATPRSWRWIGPSDWPEANRILVCLWLRPTDYSLLRPKRIVLEGERPILNTSNADGGAAVLIVERESQVRSLLCEELRAHGYRVLAAENTDEARSILRGLTHVDVVITSTRLPGTLDAARFVDWLRADQPAVKIVMISGAASERGCLPPLDGFLAKPFLPSQLTTFLKTLLTP